MKLHTKIALIVVVLIVGLLGSVGIISYTQVKDAIEIQMGNNALDIASTIADKASIKKSLGTRTELDQIQIEVEDIRENTRYQYIIVLDMDGIKYSYPYENSLGKRYRSGGEKRVLENGEEYISTDRNVLISAIRAFKPIYYDGKQVGAVIVGMLTETVYREVGIYSMPFWLDLILAILIGLMVAWLLSDNIKKSMYGLEPKEIAELLGQRELELKSLDKGIISMDLNGNISFFNNVAQNMFNLSESDIGKNIEFIDSYFSKPAMESFQNNEEIYNIEIKISSGNILLCNYIPFKNYSEQVIGLVASFQDLTEVKELAEELTGIKMMADALRAQNHEFLNKLHTISGLVQLEEYDEAIDYISEISSQRKGVTTSLNYKILNVHIAGLLLAKYNKAIERNIDFKIDESSYLDNLPEELSEDEICSILGNLIENAIDELVKVEDGKINVRIFSNENYLEIEIEDNGLGISESIRDSIFQKGVTTKSGNRGFGLHLIKKIIDRANGEIFIEHNNGTKWLISIPMKRGD